MRGSRLSAGLHNFLSAHSTLPSEYTGILGRDLRRASLGARTDAEGTERQSVLGSHC